ncbi:MAG: crossover junction endodeoxyribonuclease RuvC [Nitrospiraceae bacterium]|nr:MAG: crossover junction endodeoxyribonuclease RuvC [Nitrospiraceae bacterium]
MRIIGIDPGTICCGYGIVESGVKSLAQHANSKVITHNSKLYHVASGEVRMKQKDPLPERLNLLYDSLKTIINEYRPSQLCIEKIFYHKSIRSALVLGCTRGVVLLLAAQNDLPVFEYNSTELKMALTGYGRAEKSQVQQMVKVILNLGSAARSEDSTDALALCICHINSSVRVK